MTQQCIYFEEKTCESIVLNTKTCNNCLIQIQTKILAEVLDRLSAIEVLVKKTPAKRAPVRKTK